jgi:transposase, IS5 family
MTASQTLRSLILMRVKNWDYRELRERINDGHTLRTFTDFDSHRVPKHDALSVAAKKGASSAGEREPVVRLR